MGTMTQIKRYFNTALCLGMSALLVHSPLAQATQDIVTERVALSCNYYHLSDLPRLSTPAKPWWYNPKGDSESRYDFASQTLKILPATSTMLWSKGTRIIAQIVPAPTETVAYDNTHDAAFLIVRNYPIKTSVYRPALGQYVEVVGRASYTAGSAVEAKEHMVRIPLTITAAHGEITAQDRLLPTSCFQQAHQQSLPAQNPITTTPNVADLQNVRARVITLLDLHLFGIKDNLVLMDKGQAEGIQINQSWQLIDQVKHDNLSAKPFGHTLALQVFEHSALMQVIDSSKEVSVDTLLRLTPKQP